MKRVFFVGFPSKDGWQVTNRFPNRDFPVLRYGDGKAFRAQLGSQEDEALPRLRHANGRALHDSPRNMVPGEVPEEVLKDRMVLNLGHIFHGHKVGLDLFDQPPKAPDQLPIIVSVPPPPAPAVGRKGLAGSTTCQQPQLLALEQAQNLLTRQGFDVFLKEDSRIIGLVGEPTGWVHVHASPHQHATERKAMS
jgi:hypothetical protein